MFKLLIEQDLTFILPNIGEKVYLAFIGEQAVGTLIIRRIHNVHQILGLYVRRGFQKKGIGKKLINHFISQTSSAKILIAEVMSDNLSALAFYRSLEFIEVSSRQILIASESLIILTVRLEVVEN